MVALCPFRLRILGTAAVLASIGSPAAWRAGAGQASRPKPQPQDEEFAASVKEWTTRPEFSSPLVDHLPKSAGVPSPKDVLGYHIGAPKKLTYYGASLGYYRALAAKSPRVRVLDVGKTDEGRECVVVFVGSEDFSPHALGL